MGDNCLTTAIWKKGSLIYNTHEKKWIRASYKNVCLKYLYYFQSITDEFINKVKSYLTNEIYYGVSQNPDTKVYVLVFENDYFNKHCEKCVGEGDFTIAIWKDGPLNYSALNRKYKRKSDEKVLLKHLSNSQNINNKLLNEIIYSIEKSYGISQDPNTKDYILVLQLRYYCEKCNKKYDNEFEISTKSCLSCQTNHEDKKINDFIQETRLNIDHRSNRRSTIIFEWIPYDRGGGALDQWKREANTKVALKCLHSSQNFPDEFINKVKTYPNIKMDNILKLYGISQDPDTKDYIMVLEYAEGGNFNNYLDKNYEKFDWFNGLKVLSDIFNGLSKIHQEYKVHCNFHMGNILFTKMYDNYNACISDMELCKKIDNINETSIYGVMPYVAPEVLKGKPYTQASNIYSFEMIKLFYDSLNQKFEKKGQQHSEIEEQFKETQEYRKENFSSHKNNKSTIHAQAIYTSRLLNPFIKNLSDDNTVEITK
ncbi:kinase-like domain-containing protein [Rhizophagus clarus]|uniref:non-specific serine/threonine protein kinase n=1 Tax=Rhizophagus clarus TaxID=94130 RepID=A0A8H3MFV0_9GLOM|nr:kinase-like domain-containing protein [Rhizophagus clarus]